MKKVLLLILLGFFCNLGTAEEKLKVLIIDGHNNHDWCGTTDFLKASLEASGKFNVEVSTAPSHKCPKAPRRTRVPAFEKDLENSRKLFVEAMKATQKTFEKEFSSWRPNIKGADVILLNYNGRTWPEEVQKEFVEYVKNGGGTVLVHAANNAFRNWQEYNDMIGIGWRPGNYGKAIKIDPKSGRAIEVSNDKLPGNGNSGHGSKHPFQIKVRAAEHPVMKGLPTVWMHGSDELYHNMRGPAKNMTVLSSAYADPKQRGSGMHEPMTWEVKYGQGRVIVTSMGHLWGGDMRGGRFASLQCVGFQTIINRSCEYAATGKVTLPVPESFPGPDKVSLKEAHSVWQTKDEKESAAAVSMKKKKKDNPYCMLTPEEELATFELAPGYVAELFAAEPMVQEPVLTVWDRDGSMYVAEMRSYMQDVAGTGTKTMKNGRIKKLVDTDGDGRADKVTVFADNLNLPRCILPLGDWIAVRETDTMDVIAFRDNDGDGVADEKKVLYKRGPVGRNSPGKSVEHQDSGLMWNIDNRIYITYNMESYRYTNGEWKAEKARGHWTQWGLTHDDVGDIYWSTNSNPVVNAQIHPKYWGIPNKVSKARIPSRPVVLPQQYDPSFMKAYSTCLLNDRGGSADAIRSFTSVCGQSIYREDKFPFDTRGSYFVVDPTIHVVRRANISKDGDIIKLLRAEPEGQEFMRSSDINSRFVNTAVGPDGCLYITDMYRGIIQDAPWLNPQSRENIKKNGLDKNIQHGRIWRIRHKDFTPRKANEMPKMSKESTFSLLRHLSHEAGWWRDAAQKEIVLRKDGKSVIPHLKGLARFGENALGRLHALWTLEGLDAVDVKFLQFIIQDRDERLRRAAVQIAERFFNETDAINTIAKPLENDNSSSVAKQLILSLGFAGKPVESAEIIQKLCRKHPGSKGVQLAATLSLWGMKDLPLIKDIYAGKAFDPGTTIMWKNMLGNWNRGIKFTDEIDNSERRRIQGGETQYFASCVSCHGPDAKGVGIAGTDMMMAPSLVDSKRVKGDPEKLIPVFLHGLTGPIDGKTYGAGFMAPAHVLGITRDDRLAELISYLRHVHGNGASPVSKDAVTKSKKRHAERKTPWTDKELNELK